MNSKAQTEVLILIGVFIAVIGYGVYSVTQINNPDVVDVNQSDINQNNNSLTQIISPSNTLLNQNNNSNNQAPIPTGQSNGSNSSSQGSNQENDDEEDNSASQNNSSQVDADEETDADAEDDSADLNDDDSGAVAEPPSDYEDEEEDEEADSNYTMPTPPQPPINPPIPPASTFTSISVSAPNTSYNTYDPFTLTISTNVPGVYLTLISIFKNEEYTTNCQPNLPGSTSPTAGQYYSFGGQTQKLDNIVL